MSKEEKNKMVQPFQVDVCSLLKKIIAEKDNFLPERMTLC